MYDVCYYAFEPELHADDRWYVPYIVDQHWSNGRVNAINFHRHNTVGRQDSQEAWERFVDTASHRGHVFDCRRENMNVIDILYNGGDYEHEIEIQTGKGEGVYGYRLPGLEGRALYEAVVERLIRIGCLFPYNTMAIWNTTNIYGRVGELVFISGGKVSNRRKWDEDIAAHTPKEEPVSVNHPAIETLSEDQIEYINRWAASNDSKSARIICLPDFRKCCETCNLVLDTFAAANPNYFTPVPIATTLENVLSSISQLVVEAEERGYQRGHEEGVEAGNRAGYDVGYDIGYRQGKEMYYGLYDDGHASGYDVGYEEGRFDISTRIRSVLDNV